MRPTARASARVGAYPSLKRLESRPLEERLEASFWFRAGLETQEISGIGGNRSSSEQNGPGSKNSRAGLYQASRSLNRFRAYLPTRHYSRTYLVESSSLHPSIVALGEPSVLTINQGYSNVEQQMFSFPRADDLQKGLVLVLFDRGVRDDETLAE